MKIPDPIDDRDASLASIAAIYAGRVPASKIRAYNKHIQSPVIRTVIEILAENGPIPPKTSASVREMVRGLRRWAIQWTEVHMNPPIPSKVYRDSA